MGNCLKFGVFVDGTSLFWSVVLFGIGKYYFLIFF